MFAQLLTAIPYRPLKDYQKALDALKAVLSQQQRTEYKNALKLYTSRDDPNKFSKEEATQIFPALFTVGKSYILCADKFTEGFQWFSHAITFGEKAEPLTDFAPHYIEMGDLYNEKNQHDQGLKCLDKALEILNSVQELDDEKKIVKGRGLFYKGLAQRAKNNNLNGAAETLAQAVMILEGLVEIEEAAILLVEVYELLANIHYHRDDQPQGQLYSIKGLDLIDKTYGVDNPRGHNLARELACFLTEQDRFKEALIYVKKWENMQIKEHGANNPMMSPCYFLHGQICTYLGEYADALKKFELAEKVSKSNKKIKFEDSGETCILKSRCHFNLKNYKEAKECFDQAIEYNRKRFGENSKQLADCYYTGAEILKDSKLFKDEAKEYYLKSLEMYRNLGVACIFEVQSTITSYGVFLNANFEYKECIKILPEAMEICRKYFPTRKVLIESCHNVLGMSQVFTEGFKEGIENLETAAKLCEETGNASGKLVSHYFNLAQAYARHDQPEKAQEYGKKILEMELAKKGKGGEWINATLELLSPIYSKVNKEQEFKELETIYKSE